MVATATALPWVLIGGDDKTSFDSTEDESVLMTDHDSLDGQCHQSTPTAVGIRSNHSV